MTSKKVFFAMLGAIILVTLLTIGGVVLGSSMLKKKSADLVELKLQDRLIEEQQTSLVRAKQDIDKYQELDSIAKSIVPQDKDQAKTVRELVIIADQSRIKIGGITFPQSTLGTTPPSAAPTTSTGDGSTATPRAQTPSISQVKPVDGIKGVFEMEVDVTVPNDVTYLQLIDFLERLENNRRTAQITSIGISPDSFNRNLLNFDVSMKVFIKP